MEAQLETQHTKTSTSTEIFGEEAKRLSSTENLGMTKEEPSEINIELTLLKVLEQDIHNLISELDEKIFPILCPASESESVELEKPRESVLAGRLNNINNGYNCSKRRLKDIISRIKL